MVDFEQSLVRAKRGRSLPPTRPPVRHLDDMNLQAWRGWLARRSISTLGPLRVVLQMTVSPMDGTILPRGTNLPHDLRFTMST